MWLQTICPQMSEWREIIGQIHNITIREKNPSGLSVGFTLHQTEGAPKPHPHYLYVTFRKKVFLFILQYYVNYH